MMQGSASCRPKFRSQKKDPSFFFLLLTAIHRIGEARAGGEGSCVKVVASPPSRRLVTEEKVNLARPPAAA